MLGLTAQRIRQTDGTRAGMEVEVEEVFQAIDSDNSKRISKVLLQCDESRVVMVVVAEGVARALESGRASSST